jgi:hypothetical protein
MGGHAFVVFYRKGHSLSRIRHRIRHGGKAMRKLTVVALLAGAMAIPALAGQKVTGNTTLKDLQPAGVADKHAKHSKHQVFDLTFDATGNEYICRTDADKSVNVTNFVVGSSVNYEMDGKKAKITTSNDKKVSCTIVRVAVTPVAPRP